jgi:hypothetical protein
MHRMGCEGSRPSQIHASHGLRRVQTLPDPCITWVAKGPDPPLPMHRMGAEGSRPSLAYASHGCRRVQTLPDPCITWVAKGPDPPGHCAGRPGPGPPDIARARSCLRASSVTCLPAQRSTTRSHLIHSIAIDSHVDKLIQPVIHCSSAVTKTSSQARTPPVFWQDGSTHCRAAPRCPRLEQTRLYEAHKLALHMLQSNGWRNRLLV